MTNNKVEEVIARLIEENETFTIEVLGDEKNKNNGFGILIHCKDEFSSSAKEIYHGISKKTIELLKEAEIKFKIIK